MLRNALIAAGAATTLASWSFAQVDAQSGAQEARPATTSPANGVLWFKVGRFDVAALSDGTVPLDVHPLLRGAAKGEIDDLLDRGFEASPVETSINAFLVRSRSRLILIDAGAGELFGPFGGKLQRSLTAAGYSSHDVTDVLITHIHTDHSGGLTQGGRITFPNATVHLGQQDKALFLDRKAHGRVIEERYFDEARKTVEPYRAAGKLVAFSGTKRLFPGVTALPAPGHTPGHSIYRLESEGESLEFWGDLIHVGAVQMPRPEVTITFDVDQPAARDQRLAQFASAARERKLVAAAHLNFPGIGRLRPEATGYAWVPAPHSYR